jgi:hypothetical protein
MKKWMFLAMAVVLIGFDVRGQGEDKRLPRPAQGTETPANRGPELPRFDLDFPGGNPQQLVDALNKPLMGKLNVIIPEDSNDVGIPPMKLKNVNVNDVFQALQRASDKMVSRRTGRNQFQTAGENFSFSPTPGTVTENTVWAFRAMRPFPRASEEKSYRFYQLGPYLDGLKIEDITTAVHTALKMLEVGPGPELKFHPETKLLIAVGKEEDFQLIDEVLAQLPKGQSRAVRLSGVLVSGEVKKPGKVALPPEGKMTVLDAIDAAGGLTESANVSAIRVSQAGQAEQVVKWDELKKQNDPSKIIYLESGDIVDVRSKYGQ